MRIAFFCNDGSPTRIIPPDLYGRGVGGAENALFSLTRELAKRGHTVTVYNDPREGGVYDGVEYMPKYAYADEVTDVLVFFRSPNALAQMTNVPLKLFWSCDQHTVGDYRDFMYHVHATVVISPRHRDYFIQRYGADPDKTVVIDLGVRVEEYEQAVERIPYRFIYCSQPERGLKRLRAIWNRIRMQIPEASLVITGSHTLWGGGDNTRPYREEWAGVPNVHYFGALPRHELVKFQLQADIHAYPCTYDELFCISVAETQVAGAVPITSQRGAIWTTNEFGYVVSGGRDEDPNSDEWLNDYADFLIYSLTEDYDRVVTAIRPKMMSRARERFAWSKIAAQWEELMTAGLEA